MRAPSVTMGIFMLPRPKETFGCVGLAVIKRDTLIMWTESKKDKYGLVLKEEYSKDYV